MYSPYLWTHLGKGCEEQLWDDMTGQKTGMEEALQTQAYTLCAPMSPSETKHCTHHWFSLSQACSKSQVLKLRAFPGWVSHFLCWGPSPSLYTCEACMHHDSVLK